MRSLKFITGSALLMLSPLMVSAGTGLADAANAGPLQTLMGNILNVVNTVVIPFIIGIGFLVFVWGMFQFFIAGGSNDEAKEKGKSLMIYATLGFVLILTFWGIIRLLTASTGLDKDNVTDLTPKVNPIPAP